MASSPNLDGALYRFGRFDGSGLGITKLGGVERGGGAKKRRRLGDYSAGSSAVSVKLSSCPMVSRPNRTGTRAPVVTITASVPKKIVSDPVYGSSRKGRQTPASSRAEDSSKKWPRPRSDVGNCSEM